MSEKYNLIGRHKDDGKLHVIGTFPSEEEAQQAADLATEQDQNNNWVFYCEVAPVEPSSFG